MSRTAAILRLRCPQCLEGRVFARRWRMNPECTVCGVRFERESGFFLMAIYLAYAVDILLIAPFIVWGVGRQLSVWLIVGVLAVGVLALSPVTLQYTRVLWLHLDELFDPRRKSG